MCNVNSSSILLALEGGGGGNGSNFSNYRIRADVKTGGKKFEWKVKKKEKSVGRGIESISIHNVGRKG